jgi:hypothetical protein
MRDFSLTLGIQLRGYHDFGVAKQDPRRGQGARRVISRGILKRALVCGLHSTVSKTGEASNVPIRTTTNEPCTHVHHPPPKGGSREEKHIT